MRLPRKRGVLHKSPFAPAVLVYVAQPPAANVAQPPSAGRLWQGATAEGGGATTRAGITNIQQGMSNHEVNAPLSLWEMGKG